MQIPPIRYTPKAYNNLPDRQSVRVWYLPDFETIKRFREWFQERAKRERAHTTRAFIADQLEKLRGRDDDDAAVAVRELELRLDELGPGLDDGEDEIDAYAQGIGDMVSHFEIAGRSEPWPSDHKGRVTILRALPSPVISDLLRAFHAGDYDDEIVGK